MLTPTRQDTNSLYLTDRLNELGINVAFKTVVGDNRTHLTSVAQTAIRRADISIFMGGLGPTEDDLTREAVADALGVELRRDHEIVTAMYKRFAERRLQMPENNARQADILRGATVLPNSRGTAPGQWLRTEFEGKPRGVMLLPGPPHEMQAMWEKQCASRLRQVAPSAAIAPRVLKPAMLPESAADARTAPIYKKYPEIETTVQSGQA